MSLFEYVAVAYSLIFSFAVMRLIGGISYAFDRDRIYWVHATHVCYQLLATAISFWIMWSFREIEWTLGGFLLVLAGPGIYYFNATVLIPEAPASIESWRAHYFSVRKRYWGAICVWSLVSTASSSALLGMPLVDPMRTPQVFLFALGIGGMASARPRVHEMLAIALASLTPLGAFIFLSQPGAIAQ